LKAGSGVLVRGLGEEERRQNNTRYESAKWNNATYKRFEIREYLTELAT
jgi:hypothetical protein